MYQRYKYILVINKLNIYEKFLYAIYSILHLSIINIQKFWMNVKFKALKVWKKKKCINSVIIFVRVYSKLTLNKVR
jgi:hypothetical protein